MTAEKRRIGGEECDRKHTGSDVCDRIPEIIWQAECVYDVETIAAKEFRRALGIKLVEEAQEGTTAADADLATKLADLWEVIDALMVIYAIDRETVLQAQQRRQIERGRFSGRIKLLWSGAD